MQEILNRSNTSPGHLGCLSSGVMTPFDAADLKHLHYKLTTGVKA